MTMVTLGRTLIIDNDDQVIKMKKWCKENSIKFDWTVEARYKHWCGFHFNNNIDAMAFKLRWE